MKPVKALLVVVALAFSFTAQAGNNPLIDKALLENLAEKKELIEQTRRQELTSEPNAKYRSVEVLEMGDELGGLASSGNLRKEEVSKELSSRIEDKLEETETN